MSHETFTAWAVPIVVALGSGVAVWMFAVHAKLATIATELTGLAQLWSTVDDHEERLRDHEHRIQNVEKS